MLDDTTFHAGELWVQEKLGELAQGRRNGEAIGNAIMPGAVKFLLQQPMALVSSMDAEGQVWVSILMGAPGFVSTDDLISVKFDRRRMIQNPNDPLWANIEHHARIGALFIEPATRRRLRVNGRVKSDANPCLTLEIEEAYPNCPKYIQQRTVLILDLPRDSKLESTVHGNRLTSKQRYLLETADTFFVGSVHSESGMDVSHRGGKPGFVRIIDDHTLRIPDYSGNSMYNTLGNLVLNPRAGLLVVDFQNDQTLQLSGEVKVLWDADDPAHPTGGTRRYWEFQVHETLEARIPHFLQWEFVAYSPVIPA